MHSVCKRTLTYVAIQLPVFGARCVLRAVVEAGALGVLRRRAALVAAASAASLATGALLDAGATASPLVLVPLLLFLLLLLVFHRDAIAGPLGGVNIGVPAHNTRKDKHPI